MAELNLKSSRARKARLGVRISKAVVGSLTTLGVAMLVIGVTMLVMAMSLGWLVIGLAVLPIMVALWDTYDLNTVTAGTGDGIDQRLESNILGILKDNPSPKDIASAAIDSVSGRFILKRFGIPVAGIEELCSNEPSLSKDVWGQADEYRKQTGGSLITGAMLIAALCETQPALKAVLPHLQLEVSDLRSGVRWFARIEQLVEEGKRPKKTGGVARDWDFGWANLLARFGTNISEQVASGGLLHVRLESHGAILEELERIFSGGGRQNVALVGKLGAGKTTLVQAFAEVLYSPTKALPGALKYQQVIKLDAGAIIQAARNRSELEALMQRLFVEALRAKNIILFMDDAQLFFEEGNGSVDLSPMLLPILEGGRLRTIVAMDEQAYLRIAQHTPTITSVLNRLNVPQATESEAMAVMQDQIIQIEFAQHVMFSYQSLKEAYRLSERYSYDVVQPGRSVRLLEQAARYAENRYVSAQSVARSIEATSGVKLTQSLQDESNRDTLLRLEELIHERMINQSRAVSVVSDALRRAQAGVRNEKRPIGTFLFLGPTGVGKTELAKALAAVYFNGEDNIVRLDMNEYVREDDVARLIADGSDNPHGLAASVMKQPFSVVLLDEIEKAHPKVLATLLQMLDEGLLRDVNNREISFRDAVIIATSNAGADRIRQLIDEGKQLEEFEQQFVNELIDSRQFLPEFLNRFDEIVVFRPLTVGELEQVVERMIASVNATLVPQKVQVAVTKAALRKLATAGYDPRLGARPMRRMVQRSVENLVATRLLEGSAHAGDTITIDEQDIKSA